MPENTRQSKNANMLTQAGGSKQATYIGRVVEDKKPNSRIVKVFVKDLLPFYSGNLENKESSYSVSGGNYQGEVKATNVLEAEWMGDDTNRRFPPDVKVNEQVRVIIISDQDKVFWQSLGRDDDKRRTEVMELTAANTPNGPADLNRENTYSITADTRTEQCINLQTSKSAGEEFAYNIKLDAKNNRIVIADDQNNEIVIESSVPRIYMRNNMGALLELAKKNVTIIAPEDLMLKAGRQAIFDIPALKMVNTNNSGVTVWESAEIAFKANSVTMNAQCIGLQGAVEANNIVSGNHYATSYSTISSGPAGRMAMSTMSSTSTGYSTYKSPTIDIYNGIGTRANNTPNLNGGGGVNRHCTAWEDINAAVNLIAGDLEKIDGKIGYGNSAGAIRSNSATSIMNKNTGE